jgi:hypothetical protein
MWPEVSPGSSKVFATCYQKECGQEQMIATADTWERSTESAASVWLRSTVVTRETDVSLMETRISENFHLPRFHWSQQPFLRKQKLQATGQEVTTHLLISGVLPACALPGPWYQQDQDPAVSYPHKPFNSATRKLSVHQYIKMLRLVLH